MSSARTLSKSGPADRGTGADRSSNAAYAGFAKDPGEWLRNNLPTIRPEQMAAGLGHPDAVA
jgi:hypothetical protein